MAAKRDLAIVLADQSALHRDKPGGGEEGSCECQLTRSNSFAVFELLQPLASQWLSQLQQPSSLDLPDALARDPVDLRDFIERPRVAITKPEAQFDHFPLARRQRSQHLGNSLAEQMLVDEMAGVVVASSLRKSSRARSPSPPTGS